MLFAWEEGAELPQSKPDGFASSLWEGASGAPTNFALEPETVPLCQRPHPRGGCLRPTGADWGSSGKNPFRLAASRQATLPLLSLRDIFPRPGEVGPQEDGFSGGDKVSGSAIRRPLGGAGCERSEQTEGVLPAAPERAF